MSQRTFRKTLTPLSLGSSNPTIALFLVWLTLGMKTLWTVDRNIWLWWPWDDVIVVCAGKLRKMWDSRSELCSSMCGRRLETRVLRPMLLPVKTAQFTQLCPSGMTSHNKIVQFNWKVYRAFYRSRLFTLGYVNFRCFALYLTFMTLNNLCFVYFLPCCDVSLILAYKRSELLIKMFVLPWKW
jgi:hypothetical protein